MILESIQFPNLDPSALTLPGFDLGSMHLGPFHLRWYALAYIAGLVLGWRWMVYLIRKNRLWAPGKPPLSTTQADDFLFWATLGVILGGRLGYVLFYKPDMIWKNFAGIFQIWQGGMSFHGGLIGVSLAALLFTYKVSLMSTPAFTPRRHLDDDQFAALAKRRAVADVPENKRSEFMQLPNIGWVKKSDVDDIRAKSKTATIQLLPLGDLAACATPIGLFFGRIANFINGELWGRHADVPWAVRFPEGGYDWTTRAWIWTGQEMPRHPSQLYEATLEGLLLFAIINVLTLKFDSLRRPGLNSGVFLVCYGLFRLSLEFVREPDAHMPEQLRGYLTMGMLLSIPMIALGVWLVRRALKAPQRAAVA